MSEALVHETQNQQPPKKELMLIPDENVISLRFHQAPDMDEGELAKELAIIATSIKEGFQSVNTSDRDERYSHLLKQEVSGVYLFLSSLEVLKSGDSSFESVDTIYREISANIDKVDRETISQLADKYETHPAVRGINMLQRILGPNFKDNVVHMRRNMLIMLDGFETTG